MNRVKPEKEMREEARVGSVDVVREVQTGQGHDGRGRGGGRTLDVSHSSMTVTVPLQRAPSSVRLPRPSSPLFTRPDTLSSFRHTLSLTFSSSSCFTFSLPRRSLLFDLF